jgi:thiamine-phosphate pyrophosphorylase
MINGVYIITDDKLLLETEYIAIITASLQAGAKLFQYRAKNLPAPQKYTQAQALKTICQDYNVPFIVNDDLALAQAVEANGLHLGQSDCSLTKARAQLGKQAIIGISCYNRLDLAQQAAALGADYIAFGRFFASVTKPQAVPANIDLLFQAKQQLQLPIVAIGGIKPENGASLLAAGADSLAVINGIFATPTTEAVMAATKRYVQLFAT